MGGGNPIDKVKDVVGDTVNSVKNFAKDPINTAMRNIGDLGTNMWQAGWITIPGTNWQFNIWGGGLIGIAGIFFPGNPFYRRKSSGGESYVSSGSNPYRVQLKWYINDIKQDSVLFKYVPPANSIAQIKEYFRQNATYQTQDICVDVQNSSVRFVFNDNAFSDNDGVINLEICYLGKTEDCNCSSAEDPTDIAVGFTRVDNNMVYPVAAHGMCYVGDKNSGLSTGGRCEENIISEVEQRLLNKYKTFYNTTIDDTLSTSELQKDRILDLVYEYNGTTWVKRQNLIESVYYHTGVGTKDNALFFGGIHDTISNYTFSYNDELSSLPAAVFKDWDCEDKIDITYTHKSLYGTTYPNDLGSSVCWTTPAWQNSSNFNPTCSVSTSSCLVFNDPEYAPNNSSSLDYVTDKDYPSIQILNITDSTYKFKFCATDDIEVNFPTTYSLLITAANLTGNTFTVEAKAASISGASNGTFIGHVNVDTIKLEFKDQFYIYPNDISGGTMTDIRQEFYVKEINTNEENLNMIGVFRYGFMYHSVDEAKTIPHVILGYWALYFDSVNDLYDSIRNEKEIQALQSYIGVDASTFEASGGSFFGTGSAKFSINKKDGVAVGVENSIYEWKSSNESCGQNLASAFNIQATIGEDKELRWGVPIWNKAFAQNAILSGNLLFNSKTETSDSNIGDILHEITDISVQSNSIMGLANRRILLSGETKKQDHRYKALNDVEFKAYTSIIGIDYVPSYESNPYTQTYSFSLNASACSYGFISSISTAGVSGQVTSNAAVCCAGTHSFPSTAFINSRTELVSSNGTYNAMWDYVDGCIWYVESATVVPASGSNIININGFTPTSNSLYSCPSTVVDSLLTGSVEVTGACSGTFSFPSANYQLVSTGTDTLVGDHYNRTVVHNIYDSCSNIIGYLSTVIHSVPAGTLTVNVSGCESLCEQTISNTFSSSISLDPTGSGYSEYATSFVQEYRSDGKHSVAEHWTTSNDYNVIPSNNGITTSSNWKRWMDGVGLGGDTPDYDTIYNVRVDSTYPVTNWKEIGHWYVGQMAFGSPRKAVVVGGHRVDRSIGRTLIGSGLHAPATSKRVFVWDQTTISPEDSYLKNYYARRFNTYMPNGTVPISSNQNLSNLNCIIYEGESDIVVERVGTVEFDGSDDKVSVVFDKLMPDSVGINYSVSMTCSDNVKMWWENKTATGFEIHSEIKEWKGTVDWIATAIIKVTEQDILDKGNSSGYIFEK